MQRYIALLRGINVGGHTVKMETLRTYLEAIGLSNVSTFIASGNVIFESDVADTAAVEKQIEEKLFEELGYRVPAYVRSDSEIVAVASYSPFPAEKLAQDGSSLYVVFLRAAPAEMARDKVLAARTTTDEFHVHGREIYWWCRTKISDSPLFSGSLLDKTIGAPSTTRNITTVRKLADRLATN